MSKMSKVSIEIFEDKSCGRKGGVVFMDKDIAKKYIAKKKAKYVTITDEAPSDDKESGKSSPSADKETKETIYAFLKENEEKLMEKDIEIKGIQSYTKDELLELKAKLEENVE